MSAYRPGIRDRLVVGCANAILKLASPTYRDLLAAFIHHGQRKALEDVLGASFKPPFTEPLDDEENSA